MYYVITFKGGQIHVFWLLRSIFACYVNFLKSKQTGCQVKDSTKFWPIHENCQPKTKCKKILSFHLVTILYDPGISTVPQTPKYIADRPIYAALGGRGGENA